MQNSNIRRIDELGRIVIPKDIRKKMHIKESEPLEIYIEEDEIRIKKYSSLPDIIDYITYIFDIGSRTTKNNYILTSREKVLSASKPELIDCNFDEKFKEVVTSCTEIKNENIEIDFGSQKLNINANIVPIIVDNDRLGLLIEYNEEKELKNNDILKIFQNLIEKELNNY